MCIRDSGDVARCHAAFAADERDGALGRGEVFGSHARVEEDVRIELPGPSPIDLEDRAGGNVRADVFQGRIVCWQGAKAADDLIPRGSNLVAGELLALRNPGLHLRRNLLHRGVDREDTAQIGAIEFGGRQRDEAAHTVTEDDRTRAALGMCDGDRFRGPGFERIVVAAAAVAMAGEIESNDSVIRAEVWPDVVPPASMGRAAVNEDKARRARSSPGAVGDTYAADLRLTAVIRLRDRVGEPDGVRSGHVTPSGSAISLARAYGCQPLPTQPTAWRHDLHASMDA